MRNRMLFVAVAAFLLLVAPVLETYAFKPAGEEGRGPVPKMLRGDGGHNHPEAGRKGASKKLFCFDDVEYVEIVYFSDATHSTVVGWKIWDCQGKYHRSGVATAYCDWWRECCLSGVNDSGTCE